MNPSTPAPSSPFLRRLHNPAVVLLLLAVWLLATLGVRPLLLPDEGRYANVAREMLLGDGLVPTLNGLPFFHKPPLMYWLDMAAMHVFGVNAFAARFGAFVGAWLMGASLFLALRRWVGLRTAILALGVLATCPFFFVGSQYANLDMLVGGVLTLAILCFVRATEAPPKVDLPWLLAAWCACALAVLAKGLIGFVLPALVLGPWLLAQGRWRQILGMLHPLGLLVFALVAAPWFVLMQQRFPGFYDYFFIEQHFRRFAQATFNNVHPFWFYIAVLPLLTLPWSLWLRRPAPTLAAEATPLPGLTSLLVWWVLAVVGFFSLPSSKLVGYILPALAPWCALLGLAVARGRAWRWMIPASAALCVGVVLVLAWKSPESHRDVAERLAALQQPGDRVVFIDSAMYDVPFYAHLPQPAIVLSSWDDPEIAKHDNWRKEFADAARFDTRAAADLLWTPDRLPALRCGAGSRWLVADKAYVPAPGLGPVRLVYTGAHAQLFQLTASACAATP